MPDREELLIDLDAFAPTSGRQIKFRDKVYAVRNFQDIPADDVFLILRAEQELKGKSPAEQLELGLRFMAILAPDMDRTTLGLLSQAKILRVLQEAMGLAEVPPVGGDGPSGFGYQFAIVARFYGWPWSELRRLTLRQLHRFLALIPEIRAQERLDDVAISMMPHMKGPARAELLRAWSMLAGYTTKDQASAQGHDRAWDSLRTMVRAGR